MRRRPRVQTGAGVRAPSPAPWQEKEHWMQEQRPGLPAERTQTNKAKPSLAFTGGLLNHVFRFHISYVVLEAFHRHRLADRELFRLYFLLAHEELCFLRALKRENLLSFGRYQDFFLIDHLERPL